MIRALMHDALHGCTERKRQKNFGSLLRDIPCNRSASAQETDQMAFS